MASMTYRETIGYDLRSNPGWPQPASLLEDAPPASAQLKVRAKSLSMATASNWLLNWAIGTFIHIDFSHYN